MYTNQLLKTSIENNDINMLEEMTKTNFYPNCFDIHSFNEWNLKNVNIECIDCIFKISNPSYYKRFIGEIIENIIDVDNIICLTFIYTNYRVLIEMFQEDEYQEIRYMISHSANDPIQCFQFLINNKSVN